jgi:hypothetical protein
MSDKYQSMEASQQVCPDCGAPGGQDACQALFDGVLAREFGDYRYFRLHRLTVDAYSLQHPAKYMRSGKSYAAHLTGMYAALEGGDASRTNQVVQKWLSSTPGIERPDHPPGGNRGALNISHLKGASDPNDHLRRVQEWAESVWPSWRDYHHFAKLWIDEATTNRRR